MVDAARRRTEDRGPRTPLTSAELRIAWRLGSLVLSPQSLVLGLLIIFVTSCATTSARRSPFDLAVESASKRCACRIGVEARHLESGRSYSYNAEAEFESASVIKIAVLTEALAEQREGRVDLTARWTLTEESKADGSGTLLILDPGLNPTWSDLLTLMIGPSDNTAANAWIRRLGIESINLRMEALGFHHIRLLALIPASSSAREEPSPWRGFRLGVVSPRDVGEWMARVARGELIDREASQRAFEYLDKDPTRQRIARRFSGDDLWAGKSGSMSGVRNDAGILRTKKGRFVIVIFTDRGAGQSVSGADHPSVVAIADVAKTIVDGWSRDLPNVVDKPK
jgi:beta-lactamase class A